MKVQIKDADALRQISPHTLRAYLSTHGWVQDSAWRNRIQVWSNTRGFEILVPVNSDSDVYAERLAQVLTTLSIAEERSQLNVYRDLMETDKQYQANQN